MKSDAVLDISINVLNQTKPVLVILKHFETMRNQGVVFCSLPYGGVGGSHRTPGAIDVGKSRMVSNGKTTSRLAVGVAPI